MAKSDKNISAPQFPDPAYFRAQGHSEDNIKTVEAKAAQEGAFEPKVSTTPGTMPMSDEYMEIVEATEKINQLLLSAIKALEAEPAESARTMTDISVPEDLSNLSGAHQALYKIIEMVRGKADVAFDDVKGIVESIPTEKAKELLAMFNASSDALTFSRQAAEQAPTQTSIERPWSERPLIDRLNYLNQFPHEKVNDGALLPQDVLPPNLEELLGDVMDPEILAQKGLPKREADESRDNYLRRTAKEINRKIKYNFLVDNYGDLFGQKNNIAKDRKVALAMGLPPAADGEDAGTYLLRIAPVALRRVAAERNGFEIEKGYFSDTALLGERGSLRGVDQFYELEDEKNLAQRLEFIQELTGVDLSDDRLTDPRYVRKLHQEKDKLSRRLRVLEQKTKLSANDKEERQKLEGEIEAKTQELSSLKMPFPRRRLARVSETNLLEQEQEAESMMSYLTRILPEIKTYIAARQTEKSGGTPPDWYNKGLPVPPPVSNLKKLRHVYFLQQAFAEIKPSSGEFESANHTLDRVFESLREIDPTVATDSRISKDFSDGQILAKLQNALMALGQSLEKGSAYESFRFGEHKNESLADFLERVEKLRKQDKELDSLMTDLEKNQRLTLTENWSEGDEERNIRLMSESIQAAQAMGIEFPDMPAGGPKFESVEVHRADGTPTLMNKVVNFDQYFKIIDSSLGLQRLQGETDDDYLLRILQRMDEIYVDQQVKETQDFYITRNKLDEQARFLGVPEFRQSTQATGTQDKSQIDNETLSQFAQRIRKASQAAA